MKYLPQFVALRFLMSNQADHTIVRLRVPPELKQKIEESAEKNNRSQSAEMVARLEQSFTLNSFRITKFNDLKEIGYSIEIDKFTFGLFESKITEIELYELNVDYWVLSYHGLRVVVNNSIAKQLIEIGCNFTGSNVKH